MFKFYVILEYFKLSDVFGVKSKGFNKIREISLFMQGILENLDWIVTCGS